MSYAHWLQRIKLAEKTSIIQGRVRKVHYKFADDGSEMAEEYSMDTGVVTRRAWKCKRHLSVGSEADDAEWTIELGDIVRQLNAAVNTFVVKESISEPVLTKRVTRLNMEWRIRNLPYPIEVYSVSPADQPKPAIIVRTTNKKFYKRIEVPELERCQLNVEQQHIVVQHQHNTLIITYKKPALLTEMEKAVLLELQNVETENDIPFNPNEMLKQLMESGGGSGGNAGGGDGRDSPDDVKLKEIRFC